MLVRVFFDDNQICGVVIPDSDEELDLHHKSLIDVPHYYVDLPKDEYMEYALMNGQPIFTKLYVHVKSHPQLRMAQ